MAKKPSTLRRLSSDDRRCAEELKDWVQQVDDLLEVLQDAGTLGGVKAAEARRLFVAFKTDLRAEVQRLAGLRRRGELHGFEESDYAPAIQQALADFTVATNSTPGPAWVRELFNTRITLGYPLSGLGEKGGT